MMNSWLRVLALRTLTLAMVLLLAGWHAGARAQDNAPLVGVLTIDDPNKQPLAALVELMRRSLAAQGWVEGKTLRFVMRNARGEPGNFARAASELVDQRVVAIVAISAPATRAAFAATRSIPIIGFDYTNDPVSVGYAKSYARPSGNMTGVFMDAPEFATKWLELMREIIPDLKQIAVIWDPSPGDTHQRALTKTAPALGIAAQTVTVRKPEDIERAGEALAPRPQAVVVLPSPMFFQEQKRLAALQSKLRIPLSSYSLTFPDAGGLLAYGPDDRWTTERCALMLNKILRGAKPGDLPIERPLKFDLVVNLKTAKELNLKLPESVLIRAERVIR